MKVWFILRIALRVPLFAVPALFLLSCATVSIPAPPAPPAPPQAAGGALAPLPETPEAPEAHDARMAWWREARFGLFIHWGLYAVPAGEWKGRTNHAEWIRHTAQIPIREYEKFVKEFNPVEFDAERWVRTAKEAGMKYIVITSKHHDGFCLFDSAFTDFDIMSTPFHRDVLKELAAACRREGIRLCFYHSIMDWHHPDYLPRRPWEKRSAAGADFDRYVAYMKNQLKELLTHYGKIGVLWFDGEWEGTWTHERGVDLYNYVRRLQPDIIVNNRVDKGRGGMEGLTESRKYAGDFGTPEQQIPATGLPGVDWETCMTMNDHWGYNKNDHHWKSAEDLIRKLADIASKGGNFLLNVGPTAEGVFPGPCVERLAAIGRWMKTNGEAIYGTKASPFPNLSFGRCTVRELDNGKTNLYLHVFDWPAEGKLVVPALDNEVDEARLLAGPEREPLPVSRRDTDVIIDLPAASPDPVDSVVVLRIAGRPVVIAPPKIEAASFLFIGEGAVRLETDVPGAAIRYTLDGSDPSATSSLYEGPIRLKRTATVRAALYRGDLRISSVAEASFRKVAPRAPASAANREGGLKYAYYEGSWRSIPDFGVLKPERTGTCDTFRIDLPRREERFGFSFSGYVKIPKDGLYRFYLESDDGSRLYIGDTLLVDNDGLHGPVERSAEIALEAGMQPITVTMFEFTGGQALAVSISGPGLEKQPVPPAMLFH